MEQGTPISTWENYFCPTIETLEWDQIRLILGTDDPSCSAKDTSSLGTNGCLDIDKQVRALATREKAGLPYTGRLCASYSLKWTDDYEEKWDESRQAITRQRGNKVNLQYMAMECLTYTAE